MRFKQRMSQMTMNACSREMNIGEADRGLDLKQKLGRKSHKIGDLLSMKYEVDGIP